jgi:molybdate transport system substrate-binding protein
LATLRILSAGAAQAVTERLIAAIRRDTGAEVVADFGAVGAMKAKMTGGEPVDVIILTQPMIEELIASRLVQPGSRVDLGRVGTGVAVRAGALLPDVSSAEALRAAIRKASRLAFPDPAVATAGKVVIAMLEKLGVLEEVRARFELHPNGYAAMRWLERTSGSEMGITQITEIRPNKGVAYAGPLPGEFQMKAVYSAGIAVNAASPELARDFMGRLRAASTRPLLIEAGYELES